MKTLVISDIHHKHTRAQAIIDSVEHDNVVLLGDYFDAHGGSVEDARSTAIWLKEKVLYNPKITPLIGNHDINYIWHRNPHYRCSGFSEFNSIAINDVLNENDKNQLKFFHIEQNFAFTHAGVSNQIWKKLLLRFPENSSNKPKLEFFRDVLTSVVTESIDIANQGGSAELFGAGWDRAGWQRDGGILWVDWNHLSPLNGINQIVGHSKHNIPQILIQKAGGALSKKTIIEHYEHLDLLKKSADLGGNPPKKKILSTTYNLDTALGHYTTISNGKLDIYDYFSRVNLRELGDFLIPESPLNNLS